ncbi:MAG: phosphate/phosphite/phosphonate ABC transporter substrate-binding protein [Acidiferrobacterales bacterium]
MEKRTLLVTALYLALGLKSAFATITLTAAPRGTNVEETATYQPIADFLTKVLGEKVVYQYSDNWLSYQQNVRQGTYDIIFDGPHLTSWRIQYLGWVPLVKLPQPHVWVVVAKKGNTGAQNLDSLIGRLVCSPAPPNFGTLTLESEYSNPVEQPQIVATKGWKNGYNGVVSGKCVAAVMPLTSWRQFDPTGSESRIIFQHSPFPNQALSVSSVRFSPAVQQKIRDALLSPDGEAAMAKLRARYAKVGDKIEKLVAATSEEYAGVDSILKDTYGYDAPTKTADADTGAGR